MDDERDWAQIEERARAELDRLRFLVGSWVGEGTSHGASVQARLVVTPVLGGTFLEATELLLGPDGEVDHEDRAFYRFDEVEKRLRVLHLMAPAWTAERVVRWVDAADGLGAGLCWDGGPVAPRVEWRRDGPEGLLCTVSLPYTAEAASILRYRRVGATTEDP